MRLGKDKQVISIAVLLFLSASAGGQAGKILKYPFDGNLQKANVITGTQSIIINYSNSELNIQNTVSSDGIFYRISIPGHNSTVIPGQPELPVYSRLISIPKGSEYKVKISQVKSTRIKPSGKKIEGILYPSQEGETKSVQQGTRRFVINKALYSTRGIIASDTVRIEPLGITRNTNLANLYITPVRYNPRTNSLEVITSMKIEISFSGTGSILTKSLNQESASFDESLSKGVLNYNKNEVIPGFSDQPVKMVIITDSSFKKQLRPFIKWKTQKGIKISVLYKGTGLAGNSYQQLKDTLTKIYRASSESDPPPEYLLIIGDVNRVPYYGSGNVTDMYYGEFDGNGDYIPEMYIGRLPVADTSELRTVVSKIIQYEKFQYADTNRFYSGAIASAGYDASYAPYMNGQVKYAISNYLTNANRINEHHFYYPQSYTAKDSMIKLINKGVTFINYTGHGEAAGWLHLNFKYTDIPSLENKNMYPLIMSNACRTAQFNIANSFGNRMVLTRDKGAIGFIGCSNDSYWDEDFFWSVGPGSISDNPTYAGTGLGAYDRLFHTHGESPSDWYFSLGQINYAGNLAVSASTSSRKKYYWETYNVVGDPSLIPILGKPETLNAVLPDTLPNGIKSVTFNIPPFSYIAVSHLDTLWDASYASASGSVSLDLPGLSNDSCLIVITGQNKFPVIKTVYISDIHKEFLNLSSSGINDITGNNNNLADFGEHFFLKLSISNSGQTDAHNVYAKISSASEWISINNDSVNIGTIPLKSEINLPDKFGITVSGSVPDMSIAPISLTLKDEISEKHYTIDIALHSPVLQIISCTIDDSAPGNGNHIADPGETFSLMFKVINRGSSTVPGQFNITTPNEELSILEPGSKSEILKLGETTEIPVMVKLSETVPSGTYIAVSSILNCEPFHANKDFSFRVGRIRESFEATTFDVFPWINKSAVPWIVTGSSSFDGTVSARSGAISHNQSTSIVINTVYSLPDSLKFVYRVSSEPNYDFLSFMLNGKEVFKKSGDIPWTKIAIPVPAGLNKMEWIYKKDESVSSGGDCAWIDMIDFASIGSITYVQKDLKIARIIAPVKKDKYGQETMTVKVLNTGKDILNGFNLAYTVNDHTPAVKEFFENQLMPGGDSVTVSFNTKIDLSKYGIYRIYTYGVDNKDDYPGNDTMSIKIENTKLLEDFTVYPNPIKPIFTIFIDSKHIDKITITVTDISGVTLYSEVQNIISGKNSLIIKDLKVIPGVYYLNIRGATINKTINLIKTMR